MIDNKSKGSAPRQIAFLVIAAAILMTASMACGPRPAASPTRVTSNEIPAIAIPTVPIALPVTSVPLTATSGPSDPTISAPVTAPPPTPSPTPTPDPYAEMTIDALAARHYGGGLLEITDTLETNDVFTRYEIKYPSDGLDIYGFMNVPNEGDNFPVVLMLHGYIDPEEYEIVDYTRRYADALAEAGYFVIHPNFRNYPPSDIGPNPSESATRLTCSTSSPSSASRAGTRWARYAGPTPTTSIYGVTVWAGAWRCGYWRLTTRRIFGRPCSMPR